MYISALICMSCLAISKHAIACGANCHLFHRLPIYLHARILDFGPCWPECFQAKPRKPPSTADPICDILETFEYKSTYHGYDSWCSLTHAHATCTYHVCTRCFCATFVTDMWWVLYDRMSPLGKSSGSRGYWALTFPCQPGCSTGQWCTSRTAHGDGRLAFFSI
jgi:hypothetical protein